LDGFFFKSPTQATKVSVDWIKIAHDKAINPTDNRTRLNIVGAIDLNNITDARVIDTSK
jgi:hypothetical protein